MDKSAESAHARECTVQEAYTAAFVWRALHTRYACIRTYVTRHVDVQVYVSRAHA